VIRRQRHEQLARLGVIDETWRLSARDPQVEAWETLTPHQIEFMVPMMEVYAAMVDRLDQNIGRLVAHLEATNQIENTLILFFSDNGACPYQRLNTPGVAPGPAESDIAYDARWANMCNSPLRLYKQYAHQGGTLTPMIAHWPNGIQDAGALRSFPSHLVDLMPTVIELTGAAYPQEFAGQAILPMEGVSFAPALRGQATSRSKPIFWEFSGNHAIRLGDWKLVAERSKEWELYDLSADRTETEDLAVKEAGRVRELSARYDDWAKRVGAKTHAQCVKATPSTQSQLFDLTTVAR
jgi:arylsulfatase